MKPTYEQQTRTNAAREQDARGRDDAGDREQSSRERKRRISATQMAAPSTRRWRRAGRFEEA